MTRRDVDDLSRQALGAQVDPAEATRPAASTQNAGSAQSSPNFQAEQSEQQAGEQLKNQRFDADISYDNGGTCLAVPAN